MAELADALELHIPELEARSERLLRAADAFRDHQIFPAWTALFHLTFGLQDVREQLHALVARKRD